MRLSAQLPLIVVAKRNRKAAKRQRNRVRAELLRQRDERRRLLRMAEGAPQPAIQIDAPRFFALLKPESHDALVTFLRELVTLTLVQKRVVCIDFRPTERFYSDGTLLFYAELQRILARHPRSVKCVLPRNAVAQQVLCHLGVLRQLGHHREIPSDRDDVNHWDVLSGIMADATQGVGQAIERLPLPAEQHVRKLFRSVTEALTNVTQHAYTEPRMDGTGEPTDRGWWMFVRREPGELTVMFCDLGLGVPHTVPRDKKHEGWFAKRLESVLKAVGVRSHQDGETIRVTVEEKRSRFKAEHRGNGFGNMLETIFAVGTGRLTIYSNRGAYNFTLGSGNERHEAFNYDNSIYGTVVGWHISLPKEASA